MATTASPPSDRLTSHYARLLLMLVLVVVAVRMIALVITPLDLLFNEAQYWHWGQNLAFGYFSEPPVIGWIVGATTAVCGDTEACIRSAAPIFHGVIAFTVFLVALALYTPRTAFMAALAYLFAIGVSASSLLISSDVPLLLCWTFGLWAFIRYTFTPSYGWALVHGLALAVGINANYAMVFFPLCAVAHLVFTAASRKLLKRSDFWVGLTIGLLGLLPNIFWNQQNDFITFRQTIENVVGQGFTFDPLNFLDFVGSQFFVAGPILFGGLLYALARRWKSDQPQADRLLLFFSLPILGLLSLQAFQGSTNYNWAATAFPAVIIVSTAILTDRGRQSWVRWNLITCAAVAVIVSGAAIAALAVRPENPIISQTNLEDMFGWAEHADEIGRRLDTLEADTIVTVGRRYEAGLSYYMRNREENIRAFRREDAPPRNHFELTTPWHGPGPGERAVIISPGNISPWPRARLVGVVEADAGSAPFRSNSYLFLAVGPDE